MRPFIFSRGRCGFGYNSGMGRASRGAGSTRPDPRTAHSNPGHRSGVRGLEVRVRASSSTSSSGQSSQNAWFKHMFKSMLTTGGLGSAGDIIAQTIQRGALDSERETQDFDWVRLGRMASFGLFYYGPLNGVWYPWLDGFAASVAATKVRQLVTKVTLNQIVLGPVVVSGVFSWTLLLQKQPHLIPEKIREDLPRTCVTGWKFWVPASTVNFCFVPLQYQVLYMSSCGMVWNAILSAASAPKPAAAKA